MSRLARRVLLTAQVTAVVGGLASSTVLICRPVENHWGVLGWVLSLISAFILFALGRQRLELHSPLPRPRTRIIGQALLAAISLFCVLIVSVLVASGLRNPRPPDVSAIAELSALVAVAAICGFWALKLTCH